jgi:hypothetical protein
MDETGLQRGLFSALHVDPGRLSADERRLIANAQRNAHADSGARALGGPGACPGADAPPETQAWCVRGDVWELPALGWLQLGVVAETTPSARLAHHFLDRHDRTAAAWRDQELPRALLRARQTRSNGAPLAATATLSGFGGSGPSALTWFGDEDDPLSPRRLEAHLERAVTAASAAERDHHLALALLCAGALLHVIQDLTVPAHARGDVTAFFAPLSDRAGDRGLPLQEYVRLHVGHGPLPELPAPAPGPTGVPLAGTLRGHVLGEDGFAGVGTFAATRFLSESSLPSPRAFEADATAEHAAAALLAGAGLDPVEARDARLTPWPGPRGYLVTATGRPLAAFELDEAERVQLFLDETVYRDQAARLLPLAVDASRSILDLVFAPFPERVELADGAIVELSVPAELVDPTLVVMVQDAHGERTVRQRLALRPGERNRVVGLPPRTGTGRVVLVVTAGRPGGLRWIAEQLLDDAPPVEPLAPAPPPAAATTAPPTPAEPEPVQDPVTPPR